jgi:UDP-2,3-diacylglucosamine pyrophosphatase LpxH
MKAAIVFVLLQLAVALDAQECVFAVDEVDEFEGFHRYETKEQNLLTIFGGDIFDLWFRKSGESIYLKLSLVNQLGATLSVAENELLLKLDNDDIIRLEGTGMSDSRYFTGSSSIHTQTYNITAEKMQPLIAQRIVSVRIYFTDSYHDIKVKNKKKQDKFRDLARCILHAK